MSSNNTPDVNDNISSVCELSDKEKFNRCILSNPISLNKFDNMEAKEKTKIQNICSKNGGEITSCCDKNKLNIKINKQEDENYKEKLHNYRKLNDSGKTLYFQNNESCITFKEEDESRAKLQCKELETQYDLCKLSKHIELKEEIEQEPATKNIIPSMLLQDCSNAVCDNYHYVNHLVNANDFTDYSFNKDAIQQAENYIVTKDLKRFKKIFVKINDPTNLDNRTLLHKAIKEDSHSIIQYLVGHYLNNTKYEDNYKYFSYTDIDGNTPFNMCCLKNNVFLTHFLLKQTKKDNVNNYSIELFANSSAVTQEKIKDYSPITINNKGEPPLFSAIRSGSLELVKLLLNDELHRKTLFYTNILDHNALHCAVLTKKKNYDIIELLGDEGLNVINEDNTYSKSYFYNGTDKKNKYTLKSNPHSILKNLKKEPKTVLNLQIETLLINKLYILYNNKEEHPEGYKKKRNGVQRLTIPNPYSQILAEFPEYSPYEWVDKNGTILRNKKMFNTTGTEPLHIINSPPIEDLVSYYTEEDNGVKRIKRNDDNGNDYNLISISYDNETFVRNNYSSEDKINSDLYRDWKQEPLKILPHSLKNSTSIQSNDEHFTNYMPIKK